jgi:hypothetical protein
VVFPRGGIFQTGLYSYGALEVGRRVSVEASFADVEYERRLQLRKRGLLSITNSSWMLKRHIHRDIGYIYLLYI